MELIFISAATRSWIPSGFSKGIDKLGSVAKAGMGILVKAGAAAVGALGAAGVAVIKVGSDFEAAMSEVQAISGATGSDLEKLSDAAKEMGATTKFSASESAEALKYMGDGRMGHRRNVKRPSWCPLTLPPHPVRLWALFPIL